MGFYALNQHYGRHPLSAVLCAGFAYDRHFMVVREADYKFITQRQEPKLALVEVGTFYCRAAVQSQASASPRLCSPQQAPFSPHPELPAAPYGSSDAEISNFSSSADRNRGYMRDSCRTVACVG